jgi:hypothetical protein
VALEGRARVLMVDGVQNLRARVDELSAYCWVSP